MEKDGRDIRIGRKRTKKKERKKEGKKRKKKLE